VMLVVCIFFNSRCGCCYNKTPRQNVITLLSFGIPLLVPNRAPEKSSKVANPIS
jgi:hypothetical protein